MGISISGVPLYKNSKGDYYTNAGMSRPTKGMIGRVPLPDSRTYTADELVIALTAAKDELTNGVRTIDDVLRKIR